MQEEEGRRGFSIPDEQKSSDGGQREEQRSGQRSQDNSKEFNQ